MELFVFSYKTLDYLWSHFTYFSLQ